MTNEEHWEQRIREYFAAQSARSKRTLAMTWVTVVLLLVSTGLTYARFREERLCYSREDVVAVAAGVAMRMGQAQEEQDGGE